jgi:hypothetical protein
MFSGVDGGNGVAKVRLGGRIVADAERRMLCCRVLLLCEVADDRQKGEMKVLSCLDESETSRGTENACEEFLRIIDKSRNLR